MQKIYIIIGSVRLNRIGDQFAAWIKQQVAQQSPFDFECIDLRSWPLPYSDEPAIPATGYYQQPHTQAWSAKIAQAAGFIFVTPQYNWGYPAVLKNALDHLYQEWQHKPAMIVSYANRGGGKAAEQLKQVLIGLKMHPTATMPGLILSEDMLQNGVFNPAHQNFILLQTTLHQAMAELTILLSK